jgi:hypothetical protein
MQVVTKSEYARLKGRHPSQVTRWIAASKLTAPALRDDGDINVALADQQLADLLDPAQQQGQSRPIAAGDEVDDQILGTSLKADEAGSATKRYLDAKAEEKELEVERRRRQLKSESGAWLDAEDAKRVFARELAGVFTDIEAELTTIGTDLADKFNVEPRALTLELRARFNAFRARQARKHSAAAGGAPELQAAE